MADRSITVRLLGDAGNLGKAFKDAGQEAGSLEGKLSGLGGHLSGLGSAFSGIATTAAGFLSANVLGSAPGFFMDAAKGAAEDEAATNRLNQTLQNLVDRHAAGGLSVSELKDRMDEAIGSGQKLAFTDDEIRDSMGYLLNATDDVNDAQRRQSVAMDLARGANIDLQTATKLLGKMTDENVNTFKKLGIELPKTATEADALAAVQARFGGQADKFAKRHGGPIRAAEDPHERGEGNDRLRGAAGHGRGRRDPCDQGCAAR